MANLVENPEWVDGIYQLETTDLVEGGPDGVDNIQAIQLAKRTQFLKALILAAQDSLAGHEAASDPHPQYLTTAEGNSMIATAVSSLVNSSPATLDTLNELAAALGNDPNFATTIATALGNKQPLDQTLTALAALATEANKLIYATGPDTFSTTGFTAFARTLLDDADAATMRATLGIYGINQGVPVNTNSGVAIDFSSIPSWASRITVNLSSVNNTGAIRLQLGSVGGIKTTGYIGTHSAIAGTVATALLSSGIDSYSTDANGSVCFTLLDANTNTWCFLGSITSSLTAYTNIMSGYVVLPGKLTTVRITSTSGGTFSSGSANITYE